MDGSLKNGLTRRQFIVTTVTTAGGFAVGIAIPGTAHALPLAPQLWGADTPGPHEISAWIVIDPDGTVTIRLPIAEMGQGAATATAMMVAEELECDWSRIKGEYASANRNLQENGVYHDMEAIGSRGVRTTWQYLQQAGASARARLVAAAAKRWNVAPEQCDASQGKVFHKTSGRSLGYGALASDAAKIQLAQEPAIKTSDQYRLIGKPMPRLDTPLKINGTAQYAIDIRIPGMVYAAVASCPVFGGKLAGVDDSKIKGRRGVLRVVKLDDAVAVVADRYWRAQQALADLGIQWDMGPDAAATSAQFRKLYRDTLDGPMVTARNDGDVDGALKTGKVIEALYEAPHVAHAQMEPLNATVDLQPDKLDVWLGSQAPPDALKQAAAASGIDPRQVHIHNCYLGGGFGRRTEHDEMRHAIAIAKVVQRPLKLVWSREQDMRHDRYRPQAAASFKAVLGTDGLPVAIDSRIACGSILRSLGESQVESGVEEMAVDGVSNIYYRVPNFRVGLALKNTHVPVMYWRSVGGSQNVFFMESFIDELAHAAGQDPYEFRRAMLADRKDLLNVLDLIAKKSNWGSPLPAGRGRGIAIAENHHALIGQVIEVTVNPKGDVRVDRVVAAVDCYRVVNPRIAESQVTGGIVYGLSAALHGEITIKDGAVEQGNFDTYPVLRLADTPPIEVYFSLSGGKFGGIGETGVATVAPAIANAIFAATGKRIRQLPLSAANIAGAA